VGENPVERNRQSIPPVRKIATINTKKKPSNRKSHA